MKTFSIKTSTCLVLMSILAGYVPFFTNAQNVNTIVGEYEEGEVIVKYKENQIDIDKKNVYSNFRLNFVEGNLERKEEFNDINSIIYESEKKTTKQLVEQLKDNSNIEYVQPNYKVKIFESASLDTGEPADPDDTFFDDQWALDNDGQSSGVVGRDIQSKAAWELMEATGSGTSMLVSIIDTGIDYTHTDLRENLWFNPVELVDADDNTDGTVTYSEVIANISDCDGVTGTTLKDLFCSSLADTVDDDSNGYIDDFVGWDTINEDNDPFDDHSGSHGTHVAGIIGADKDNTLGIAGINTDVKLVAIKAFGADGEGNFGTIIAGIDYSNAVGVKITNNSFGTTADADYRDDQENASFPYPSLRNAIETSGTNNGTIFIVASGNGRYLGESHPDNTNNGYNIDTHSTYTNYPAAYDLDNIITVASSDNDDDISSFSNYGQTSVDVAAPGNSIYSTLVNATYGNKSGTSMATPMVTGSLSYLYKYWEYLYGSVPTAAELKEQIVEHTEYVTALNSYLSPNSNDVHGKRLNLFDIFPPEIEYTLSDDGSGDDLPADTDITIDITSNKPVTLNLASNPDTYDDAHSIVVNENGKYDLEFEDAGRNVYETPININWILSVTVSDAETEDVIYTVNEDSFDLIGGCYGSANVSLSIDDTDGLTPPVTASNITCTSGYWTTTLDLSTLTNGTITVTPSQPTAPSAIGQEFELLKTTSLPEDPDITSPADGYETYSSSVNVSGTGEPLGTITITGGASTATTTVSAEGTFSTSVSLTSESTNELVASLENDEGVPAANTDSVTVIQEERSSGGGGGGGGSSDDDDLIVEPLGYPDISNSEFAEYIENLDEANVISGYSDGTFRPDDFVTREQMAKFVVNAFEFDTTDVSSESFPDIDSESKFILEISVLKRMGIIGGYSDGTFRPSNYITRDEVTKFIVLAMSQEGIDVSGNLVNQFPDLDQTNPFAYYINYLAQASVNNETILGGYSDGTFRPNISLSRGQMAKIIWNSMQYTEANL